MFVVFYRLSSFLLPIVFRFFHRGTAKVRRRHEYIFVHTYISILFYAVPQPQTVCGGVQDRSINHNICLLHVYICVLYLNINYSTDCVPKKIINTPNCLTCAAHNVVVQFLHGKPAEKVLSVPAAAVRRTVSREQNRIRPIVHKCTGRCRIVGRHSS